MRTLFNIQSDYQAIAAELEQSGGELTDELAEALTINQSELSTKTLGYIHIIEQLKSDVRMGKDEIKRAQEYVVQKERVIARLETALHNAACVFGEIATGTRKVSLRKSESVQITDEDVLPKEYVKHRVETVPDKAAIKQAIKAGEYVPGAELRVNQNLVIK